MHLLLLACVLSLRLSAQSEPKDLEVFLLVGQSNMAGRGAVEEQDRQPVTGVYVLNKELRWVPAVDPLHFDKPAIAGVGVGRSFAAALLAARPGAAVGLIPAAVGGSSLEQWRPESELYNEAVRRTRAATRNGRLRGILWHQGEAECGNEQWAATYARRFEEFAGRLRADLGMPDLPVVVGELGPFFRNRSQGDAKYVATVNRQLALLGRTGRRIGFASSVGLKDKGDGVHFDSASLREFGKRFAFAFLNLDPGWGSVAPITSQWRGYEQRWFTVDGVRGYVVLPRMPAPGKPWLWRARFAEYHPEAAAELLGKGFHLASYELPNIFGEERIVRAWEDFYAHVTREFGLSPKPALEGVSRGGLFVYFWALRHPDKVSAIYCESPVLDVKSWPGGKGKGRGSAADWASALGSFSMTEEELLAWRGNPLDRAAELARHKVPVLHIVNERDQVVPPQENTDPFAERYRAAGGPMTVHINRRQPETLFGHHFPLDNPGIVTNFLLAHTPGTEREALSPLRPALGAEVSVDPLAPHLDTAAPQILRELPVAPGDPSDVKIRLVVFASSGSVIFAVIASPIASGKYPGILVVHGGGGNAEERRAIAWARRGYISVAPDLPSISNPEKTPHTIGPWKQAKYGSEGRFAADPTQSVLVDAVAAGWRALKLLESQPGLRKDRLGIVGVSWGGCMTTMLAGLAGGSVRAAFSVFGSGFYEDSAFSEANALGKLTPDERDHWLRWLDAGRRARNIRATYFAAAAANDHFFRPPAVMKTLAQIPGERNLVFGPNRSHAILAPGGTNPQLSRDHYVEMEIPYFDYHLKGEGASFPKVVLTAPAGAHEARFRVDSALPVENAMVYWSPAIADWRKRQWTAIPAVRSADGEYRATLPAEAEDWYGLASDSRPVSVSSEIRHAR
jgi:dienelactone hydrolase